MSRDGKVLLSELPGVPHPNTARLYALVARARRRAVVFRRGPSKQVRLLVWELGSDALIGGQWLKGRIYERRCDLSPNGEMLAYFAASYRPPFGTWTAISRPPFLTALALWPKGDAWGGGGLFARPSLLELNHTPQPDGTFPLADGFRLPPGLEISPMGPHSGKGENWPIEHRRLLRDGWTLEEPGEPRHKRRLPYGWIFDPPQRYQRPVGPGATLATLLHALFERQGRHDVRTAIIEQGTARRDLGRVDWADADHTGDVLYAADGCLYRIAARNLLKSEAVLVADLNGMTFEPVVAPPDARR